MCYYVHMQGRKKAFTLIEILVTVTIIGVLTAAGVTSYVRALKNGRDGRRKSDIANIQQALVMYRYENTNYPASAGSATQNWKNVGSNYLATTPVDPLNTGDYVYKYYVTCSSNKKFVICAKMENNQGNASAYNTSNCTFTSAAKGTYYCLTNP